MKTIYELIATKRDKGELTKEEISYLVDSFTKGVVRDYQMSALLMASFINGLTPAETSALTLAMLNSGDKVKVAGLNRPLVDKHSTGGVGDKLSLTIAPVLANCGIAVGMFSGRGLGHTGGTLDKLEAIPGMKVFHSAAEFSRLLKKHHFAISGQTARIAPADKKIYALRDATGTVESIPLIVASIISKKLALKSDGILFDVKSGSGAFMKSRVLAMKLAHALMEVSSSHDLPSRALVTNMNQPTGSMIGNFLEVKESIDVLKGAGPADTRKLTIELGAEMLMVAKAESDIVKARKRVKGELDAGYGYESFLRYVAACGGSVKSLEGADKLISKAHKCVVKSKTSGYITKLATDRIGFLVGSIGAGRVVVDDIIDPMAGLEIVAKLGAKVSAGDTLAIICTSKNLKRKEILDDIAGCFTLGDVAPQPEPLILKRI